MAVPPLKPLHRDDQLIKGKLDKFEKATTEELIKSLQPGQQGSFKTRADGTMIDGHHRIKVLRGRGVDVDALPREVIPKEDIEGGGENEEQTLSD
jgi:hypothetical protein